MVYVEGGTFTMGAKADENYWDVEHAWPAHQVTVSGFYLCRYETTQALWQKVMGKNPSEYRGANHPVESVSWNDIQNFIRKLNALTGKHYRLPTEAEWEWAARGGKRSQGYRYSGSNNIDEVAWYKRNTHDRHMPVGTKRPNELGLYDMSGNVYEFCGDGYAPYTSDVQNNPCPAAADGDHPIRAVTIASPARAGKPLPPCMATTPHPVIHLIIYITLIIYAQHYHLPAHGSVPVGHGARYHQA